MENILLLPSLTDGISRLLGLIFGDCDMVLLDTIISIVTVVAIVGSLYLTVRHFKIVRTLSFIERFHNSDMVATHLAVDNWLNLDGDNAQRLKHLDDKPGLKAQICLFVSFFTEIGIAYRYGTLNKKVTFDIWAYLVPTYWQKLEFFVKDRQEKVSPDLYKSFKILAKAMPEVSAPAGKNDQLAPTRS